MTIICVTENNPLWIVPFKMYKLRFLIFNISLRQRLYYTNISHTHTHTHTCRMYLQMIIKQRMKIHIYINDIMKTIYRIKWKLTFSFTTSNIKRTLLHKCCTYIYTYRYIYINIWYMYTISVNFFLADLTDERYIRKIVWGKYIYIYIYVYVENER